MVNKTKTFLQYKDEDLGIRVDIHMTGKVQTRSRIQLYLDLNNRSKSIKSTDARCRTLKRYNNSLKGYESRKKYNEKDRCKRIRKAYQVSDKGKQIDKTAKRNYRDTDKGRESMVRIKAKRNRNLGYNPINNHFEGSEGHHLNEDLVMYIPKELHKSISHSVLKDRNMTEINDASFEWLCTQEAL